MFIYIYIYVQACIQHHYISRENGNQRQIHVRKRPGPCGWNAPVSPIPLETTMPPSEA